MKWAASAITLLGWIGLATTAHAGTLRIGSKRFTESMILAEIAVRTARATGESRVEHVEGLGGTAIVLAAVEQGAIDVYPEYTGSLKESLLHDVRAGDADLARTLASRGLGITATLGFENAYALAMKRERAGSLHVARLSDLAMHPELRIALSNEFIGRSDGWSGLRAAYGLDALAPRGISVNAASPGWVRTSMGGESAPLGIDEGAQNIVRLVTDLPSSLTNRYLENVKEVPW